MAPSHRVPALVRRPPETRELNCPVSKLLKAKITLDATLES